MSGLIGEIDRNLYIIAQYKSSNFDGGQILDNVNAIWIKYGRRWRPAQKLAKFIKESGKKRVTYENIPYYSKRHIERELREKYRLILKDVIMESV